MVAQLGRVYGEEALARGIGIVLAPVLDIFETGGIYPSLRIVHSAPIRNWSPRWGWPWPKGCVIAALFL